MKKDLYPVPELDTIRRRLPLIFREGLDNRNYLIRDIAARTIFVMFYANAVSGTNQWIRPNQVTKMTDEQSRRTSEMERLGWRELSLKPGGLKDVTDSWYAENTREPIRDETLRDGLVRLGAVVERPGIPTTSSKPRYALHADFARLFLAFENEEQLSQSIESYLVRHLAPNALARILLASRTSSTHKVIVSLPDGSSRVMSPGPSSIITKEVIETFTRLFLTNPALVFLSESSNKIIVQDNELARKLGLHIDSSKYLPDIILADILPDKAILVFVEVVATDGSITPHRKDALQKMALKAG